MILVTGATGSIGRHIVQQLSEYGASFRALVRDPSRGALLGAPYVVADFDAPETLGPALAGVDRVLLNGSVDEAMVPRQTAMIDAAAAAGVAQIVRISAAGASATSDRVINRWHAQIEVHLAASGIAWTSLRPTYFMQNFLSAAETIRGHGRLYGGFRNGRIAFIDCRDIAAAAVAMLTQPPSSGQAFVLTGGETLSFAEVAAKLSAGLGKPVSYIDRPPSELVAAMKARGVPPSVAESFGTMMESFAGDEASAITSAVAALTGRQPRRFDDFLADHLDAFR